MGRSNRFDEELFEGLKDALREAEPGDTFYSGSVRPTEGAADNDAYMYAKRLREDYKLLCSSVVRTVVSVRAAMIDVGEEVPDVYANASGTHYTWAIVRNRQV